MFFPLDWSYNFEYVYLESEAKALTLMLTARESGKKVENDTLYYTLLKVQCLRETYSTSEHPFHFHTREKWEQ